MADKRSTKRALRGTGSVFHEANRDRWRGKITIDGQSITVYDRTKTGVRTKLNEVIRAGGKPKPIAASSITVSKVLDDFLNRDLPSRDRERAASTLALHRWAAGLVRPHIGTKPAEKLRVVDVDDLLDTLAADGMSRSSLLKVRGTLSMALRYAVKREQITRNVAVDATIPATAARTKPRTALSPDDARILLDTLRTHRNGAMYALSLRLGLRPGEAAALHWGDIAEDSINVTRGLRLARGRAEIVDELKTVKAKRTIGLPADLRDWLNDHRRDQIAERLAAESWIDEDLVFTTPTGHVTDPSKNRRDLAAICAAITKARREDNKKAAAFPTVRPNELRHACASLLSDEGFMNEEIADLLGHVDTSMVEATYRHRLRPVVDVATRAGWAKSS